MLNKIVSFSILKISFILTMVVLVGSGLNLLPITGALFTSSIMTPYSTISVAEIPEPTTSLTVCKQDDEGDYLDGWQMNLAADISPEIGHTPIDITQEVGTTLDLPAGSYLIKASGTYQYGNASMIADAGFAYRPSGISNGCDCWFDGWDYPSGQPWLMLLINGEPIRWGEFSESHVYYTTYHHPGGDLQLSILDDFYGDNVNTDDFGVEVLSLDSNGDLPAYISQVTGDDQSDSVGCTTFPDLALGDYYLWETLVEDWQFVSRSDGLGNGGPLTLTEDPKTITFVNSFEGILTMAFGYETAESGSLEGVGECDLETNDTSQSGSSVQILKFAEINGATDYMIQGYRWHNEAWQIFGSPYSIYDYPDRVTVSDGVITYSTWATQENIYTYLVEAVDNDVVLARNQVIIKDDLDAACTFMVDRTPPPVPTLLSPESGATGNSAGLVQTWTQVEDDRGGEVTYLYESYDDADLISQRWSDTFTNSEHGDGDVITKEAGGAPNGDVYWRVRAVDRLGNESDWSEVWHFEIDNSLDATITNSPEKLIEERVVNGNFDFDLEAWVVRGNASVLSYGDHDIPVNQAVPNPQVDNQVEDNLLGIGWGSSVSQNVKLSPLGSQTLSFWYYLNDFDDAFLTDQDSILEVFVNNELAYQIASEEIEDAGQWRLAAIDITELRDSFQLEFRSPSLSEFTLDEKPHHDKSMIYLDFVSTLPVIANADSVFTITQKQVQNQEDLDLNPELVVGYSYSLNGKLVDVLGMGSLDFTLDHAPDGQLIEYWTVVDGDKVFSNTMIVFFENQLAQFQADKLSLRSKHETDLKITLSEDNDLQVEVEGVEPYSVIDYQVEYAHLADKNSQLGGVVGSYSWDDNVNSIALEPVFLGSCSDGGSCTVHEPVEWIKVKVVLRGDNIPDRTVVDKLNFESSP